MSEHLSESTCLEMLHPKTDEHVNPGVEVHHLVGKSSTAETLLTEVQRSFLVINVCYQGKTLCSPCTFVVAIACFTEITSLDVNLLQTEICCSEASGCHTA